nr:unnamed protein product [Digitaria exilis]
MTMPWGVAVCIVDMVWVVLAGWVSTCLVVANEIARAMRNGEIGPFVGKLADRSSFPLQDDCNATILASTAQFGLSY